MQESGYLTVLAVILPADIKLPLNATGLYVINNLTPLGNEIEGEGAILPYPFSSNEEKVVFSWKEAEKTKQKNKKC